MQLQVSKTSEPATGVSVAEIEVVATAAGFKAKGPYHLLCCAAFMHACLAVSVVVLRGTLFSVVCSSEKICNKHH